MMTKIEVVILRIPSRTLRTNLILRNPYKRHLELLPVQWAKPVFDFSLVTKKIWCYQRQSRAQASSGSSKTSPHPPIFVSKKNLWKQKIPFFKQLSWRAKDYEDVLAQLHYVTLCKIETTFHQYRGCIFRYHDSLHNYDNTLQTPKNRPIFL